MMKKNILCFAATLALVMSGVTSCLEKYPSDAFLDKEAMKTFSDAEQTMVGIYSALKSGALYSGNLTILPDIQCDLVYAVDGFSNTYGQIWQWNILPTDKDVEAVYAGLYTVIGRCNFYLDQVDALKASLTDDEEIDYLDQYTGEVILARALAYSELVKCFCKAYDPATAKDEPGVVLRKHYFQDEPARRASLFDSYDFIVKEIIRAEGLLDEDDDMANNTWLSLAAAHALHARVALYMQDWDAAIEYSGKVIGHPDRKFALTDASLLYAKDGDDNQWTEYQYMWDFDEGAEVIWKVAFEPTSYGGALGTSFLGFMRDYTYYYPDFVPGTWALELYSSNDMRYDALFYTFQTGYANGLTWPLLVKYYGNREFLAQNIYHVNEPKVFRLAEQYLIRAEAYCRKDAPDFGKASEDLTALRKKRFAEGGGAISVNEENWLQTISEERVRELYMEGFRLHDLKRWNMGFERTPQEASLKEGSSLKIAKGDPRFVWPIPRNEVEAPGSEIEQNKY